jgi:hypothetical protein
VVRINERKNSEYMDTWALQPSNTGVIVSCANKVVKTVDYNLEGNKVQKCILGVQPQLGRNSVDHRFF